MPDSPLLPRHTRSDLHPEEKRGLWGQHSFDQHGADLTLLPGVTLQLARDDSGSGWSVWGIKIDGKLYREPRDLTGEPLHEGPFLDLVRRLDREKGTPR